MRSLWQGPILLSTESGPRLWCLVLGVLRPDLLSDGEASEPMSATRYVRTRTPGWCDGDFAHPSRIDAGDIVAVTTYYPRDEYTSWFGVPELTRTRKCQWCVEEEQIAKAGRGEPTLRLRDRHGDEWDWGEDGLMHSFETAPFSLAHVRRKWGPLWVVR